MKPLQLSITLIFFPVIFYAQSLTGLWMGKMSNDSNTVRKDDEYEIVLTQYKNKVYGYTRNTFFVDENLYYIVKKVEGEINGNVCEVMDVGIIMHNFPQKPERKVRVKYTFRRNTTDSTWNLDGEWKTNTTKKYYSISGKSDLSSEKDLSKSKLFPHLEELNETKDIAFYNDWKKEKEASVASKDNTFKQEFLKSLVKTEKEKNSLATAKQNQPAIVSTDGKKPQQIKEIIPEEKKTDIAIEKQVDANKNKVDQPILINTSSVSNSGVTAVKVEEKKTSVSNGQKITADKPVTKPAQTVQVNTSAITNKDIATVPVSSKTNSGVASKPLEVKNDIAKNNVTETKTTNLPAEKPSVVVNQQKTEQTPTNNNIPVLNYEAAKNVAERDFEKPQEINFTSDSLVLALYDNGEVDGDTVSVLLNGEVIVAKQCLKTVAFKKTIYIPHGEYQANVVLYAENLGIYPPNTGLLVIYDGEERYNVRFSADFKKNAAIVLKRKK
jgi:hypothetical protein